MIRVAVTIARPLDVVWAELEQLERHGDWMSDAAEVRLLPGPRRGVGAQIEVVTRVGPLRALDRLQITEWQPGVRMAASHLGLVKGHGAFELREEAGETTLVWEEELRFPWWLGGRLAAVVTGFVLKRVWRRNLSNFRRLVMR